MKRIKVRSSRETELAKQIISHLREVGFECIRVNAGNRPTPGGGYARGARKGTPDWLVVHPYCWLEIKDLTKLSKAQKAWHAWAKRCGVPVAMVRSIADAVKFVRVMQTTVEHFERLEIEEAS